jgi:hypothetical protein
MQLSQSGLQLWRQDLRAPLAQPQVAPQGPDRRRTFAVETEDDRIVKSLERYLLKKGLEDEEMGFRHTEDVTGLAR